MSEPYFRGFHAIGEVATKARRLAEHCARFTDCVRVLRLYRRDYDLVARWPKAAALHGFEFTGPGGSKSSVTPAGRAMGSKMSGRNVNSCPGYRARLAVHVLGRAPLAQSRQLGSNGFLFDHSEAGSTRTRQGVECRDMKQPRQPGPAGHLSLGPFPWVTWHHA